MQAGLTRESVVWAFTTFHGANWFPLTWLSWMLDAELYGLSPRGFHATSLALHVVNAVLALVAFTRLTGSLGVGAFTAGVFALHPLHVESVAWAAARKDVLSGLFWMLALLGYERWARRGASPLRGAAVALAFLCGLLAKPVVVALPFVLLLLDVWPLRRLQSEDGRGWDRARVRRALLEKAGLLAIAAALRRARAGRPESGRRAATSSSSIPFGARVGNAVVAYATYLRRAFLPDRPRRLLSAPRRLARSGGGRAGGGDPDRCQRAGVLAALAPPAARGRLALVAGRARAGDRDHPGRTGGAGRPLHVSGAERSRARAGRDGGAAGGAQPRNRGCRGRARARRAARARRRHLRGRSASGAAARRSSSTRCA